MRPYEVSKRLFKLNEWKWAITDIFVVILMTTILGSYILSSYYSGTTILAGSLFALWAYLDRINGQFFRFGYMYSKWITQRVDIENGHMVTNQFEKVKNIKPVSMKDWNQIQIKNLTFSYEKQKSLNNVSFEINRNEKITLIGHSGSGKTTILKLMRDLYKINKGEILIDGKKLNDDFASIKNEISLIPQDPEIFNSTILNNITLGVTHKLSFIKKLAKIARFDIVVNNLPNKYKSSIFEKGVNLSGGEKQRLALTRGILASLDKKIILLDEPTSSVDPSNELMIYQTLFSKFSDKTILSSIHRFHLLTMFDKIIFFQKGKIIAMGTLNELIQNSKEFKKEWNEYLSSMKKHLNN